MLKSHISKKQKDSITFDEYLKEEHVWTPQDIGRNSISGLLEPVKDQFSFLGAGKVKEPLQVPPTQYRKVTPREFDTYLKSIEQVIDKYSLNKQLGSDSGMSFNLFKDQLETDLVGLEDVISKYNLNSKIQGKAVRPRMLASNVPPKEIVPTVFTDSNFDLSNPHVFSAITDFKDVIGASATDSSSIRKEIQDKLKHYSETIEIYLLKEISKRSTSFFEALSHLKALQIEAQYCSEQILKLKGSIDALSKTTAKKGLEVVKLKRRRGNVAIIHNAVRLFSQLKQTQPLIRLMISQADYVSALDLLDIGSSIINGKSITATGKERPLETVTKG